MWCGVSPEEPRSSAISLLPAFHLPTAWGGRRRSLSSRRRTSLVDQCVDLLQGQVVVVPMVEPQHRRELARTEALDLLQAEQAVGRNLLCGAHVDLLLEVVDDLVGAAQHAAEVGADVEPVLADRLEMEERVESRAALDVSSTEL